MCAWDHRDGPNAHWDLRFSLFYDARQRMTDYEVFAIESATGPGQHAYPHNQVYPSHSVKHEFADASGKYQVTYSRQLQADLVFGEPPPDPVARTFTTRYQSDAAGRLVSVERDGKLTSYQYKDSTVLPSVTETRPDGSKTLMFLDQDGLVRRIAHTNESGTVLASFEYTRDANGRVTQVQEEIQDSQSADGYRSDHVEYTYGDGNLSASDLDVDSSDGPDADKLYYDWLAGLGAGRALQNQNPNRLIRERRTNSDPDDAGAAITFVKQYWYDPGGNRLVMRESQPGNTPAEDVPVSVTRYNYYAEDVDAGNGVPGTPIASGDVATDYEGHGRNLLISTQTHYPDDPNRIEVTTFNHVQMGHAKQEVMLGKGITKWLKDVEFDFWFPELYEGYSYQYDRGQLSRVSYYSEDYCPNVPECGTCTFECVPSPEVTQYAEWYSHDIFGRRIESMHCDTPNLNPPPDEFYSCKWQSTMYDYDGLSQNVLAIRKSPVEADNVSTADRFQSTFTYGALGVISRTEEFGNSDPDDNADHYYLPDAMGGNAAMFIDHDTDEMTPRIVQSQVHDSFGNLMTDSIEATAEYAWRGQEGSETDRAPGLVDMQARTYDPTIGRFLQADTLPISSSTTQGLHRFAYCENEPINASDPLGLLTSRQWLGAGLMILAGLIAVGAYFGLMSATVTGMFGFLLAWALTLLTVGIFALGYGLYTGDCKHVEMGLGLISMANVFGFFSGLNSIAGLLRGLIKLGAAIASAVGAAYSEVLVSSTMKQPEEQLFNAGRPLRECYVYRIRLAAIVSTDNVLKV